MNYAQKEIRQQRQKKVPNNLSNQFVQGHMCGVSLTNCFPQEDKADQRLKKEAQVTLYRNYRVGDFPDIQIPHSSLIAPLQALAQVRRILLSVSIPLKTKAVNVLSFVFLGLLSLHVSCRKTRF